MQRLGITGGAHGPLQNRTASEQENKQTKETSPQTKDGSQLLTSETKMFSDQQAPP